MQSSKPSIIFFNTNYKHTPLLHKLKYCHQPHYARGVKYKQHVYKKIPMELQFCLAELLASGWKYCTRYAQCICNNPNYKFMLHMYIHILLLLGIFSFHYYYYYYYYLFIFFFLPFSRAS